MSTDWRDRLLSYDEKNLDPTERAELERILDAEPAARAFLAQLRADREQFREAFRQVRARPDFTDRVMARLPQPRRSFVPFPRLMEVLAGGLMLLVAASLIAPGRQSERQRQLLCQNEVKDLTRAVMSYAEDFDGLLPNSQQWIAQVSAYRRAPVEAHCPSDDRPAAVSYSIPLGLSMAQIKQLPDPQSQVVLFDANGPFPAPRHDRAANFGFLDGSVRAVHEDDVHVVSWSAER